MMRSEDPMDTITLTPGSTTVQPSKRAKLSLTRALSSTKPSARCMALATRFSIACRKAGKGLGGEAIITLRAGDKADVILAQQCCSRFNSSQQQSRCVVSNSVLWY